MEHEGVVIVRSAASFKRLQVAARQAMYAAKEMEHVRLGDLIGRIVFEPGCFNRPKLDEFLELATKEAEAQGFEVVVIALPTQSRNGREEQHKHGDRIQRRL